MDDRGVLRRVFSAMVASEQSNDPSESESEMESECERSGCSTTTSCHNEGPLMALAFVYALLL